MDEKCGESDPALCHKGRGTKRIADEGKPVVVVPVVLEPIEVGLALGAVEPDVATVLLALERKCAKRRLCHCPLNTLKAV